jgi:predicted dehydrogenase
VRVALVGCGNIAGRYAADIARAGRLELVGATDLVPGRAEDFVAEHGGIAWPALDALLVDDRVDLVVNLTAPQAHAAVTRAALEAGKHVHTEKPLALDHAEAQALAALAAGRGLRLSAAPATLLGEAQQTAWKLVRDGAVGRVRVAYAEANWGRIESWHPDPSALYAVGPLVDVGVYPLTIATAVLGPARRVHATASVVERDRNGFRLETPDLWVAVVELDGGAILRLTASFYVGPSMQRGLELHGDDGSLYLPTWGEFDSRIELKRRDGEYERIPAVREPYAGIDWSRAIVDVAEAVEGGRPHRTSGEHAAHVVEVLAAARTSAENGAPVEVASSFTPPEPMEWAR